MTRSQCTAVLEVFVILLKMKKFEALKNKNKNEKKIQNINMVEFQLCFWINI